MMAILNRRQELPSYRTELYDQASRVLLYNWDIEYKHLQIPVNSIGPSEKQAILRQIAYAMQASEKGLDRNIISEEELLELLTRFLREREFTEPRDKANILVEQLRARNFILCSLCSGFYAFIHRTFLEFFCASEIIDRFREKSDVTQTTLAEQIKSEVLDKHWKDESWHEVLRLITGGVGNQVAGSIISYFMEQQDEFDFYTEPIQDYIISITKYFSLVPKLEESSTTIISNFVATKYKPLVLAAQCLAEISNHINIKPRNGCSSL